MKYTRYTPISELLPYLWLCVALVSWSFLPTAIAEDAIAAMEPPTEVASVVVRPFAELAFYPHYETPAIVEALRYTHISSRMEAIVETVLAEVGDNVQAGQSLASLDCRVPEARAEASKGRAKALKAKIDRTQLSIRRLQSLSIREHASRDQLDDQRALALELQATLQAEQSEGQALAARVQDCNVTAPFAGTIIERQVSPGHLATPGETLYTLLDPESLEVTAGIPEQRMPGFLAAQDYLFWGADGGPTSLKLKAAPPWIDPMQRTNPVRLVAVSGRPLVAGRSGNLRWQLATPHLPARLLVRHRDTYGVFWADDGMAHFIAVAEAQEGRAFSLELDPQALLVTEGRHNLRDGQALSTRIAPENH